MPVRSGTTGSAPEALVPAGSTAGGSAGPDVGVARGASGAAPFGALRSTMRGGGALIVRGTP